MKKPKYKAASKWLDQLAIMPKTKKPKSIKGTQITILGCGSSTGAPVLFCTCKTCKSKNPKNNRLRASVVIQAKDKVFLIDTSPDLRMQAMRAKLGWIDAVLYTHDHADHVHGLDELRTFNYIMSKAISCYGNKSTISALRKKFSYIFTNTQEGGGKPVIDLHEIQKPFKVHGIKIIPLEIMHGKISILGFRINNVAYITDCSYIPEKTYKYLKGLDVLVMDCLRYTAHPTHVNVEESLKIVKRINAQKTVLTHMTHELEYENFKKSLPKNVEPAFDGMILKSKK